MIVFTGSFSNAEFGVKYNRQSTSYKKALFFIKTENK